MDFTRANSSENNGINLVRLYVQPYTHDQAAHSTERDRKGKPLSRAGPYTGEDCCKECGRGDLGRRREHRGLRLDIPCGGGEARAYRYQSTQCESSSRRMTVQTGTSTISDVRSATLR